MYCVYISIYLLLCLYLAYYGTVCKVMHMHPLQFLCCALHSNQLINLSICLLYCFYVIIIKKSIINKRISINRFIISIKIY